MREGGPSAARWPRLLRLATVAVALVLVALVLRSLSWSDRLVWQRAQGELELRGELLGSWRGERARFRVADLAAATPELPAALGPGRVVELARGADAPLARALGGSFDWRPGMARVLREFDGRGALLALAALLAAQLLLVTRWWRLLALAGCGTSWAATLRMSAIGLFFNGLVPGLTGGDLVKAVLAAREHPGRRADALVSVGVDRGIGLLALAAIGALMVLLLGGELARFRLPVLLFLGAGGLVALALASRRLRVRLHVARLLERVPFGARLASLDRALLVHREHPRELALAFALSLAGHLLTVAAFLALARAFGAELGYATMLALVPVASIVSALPIAAGGWGLGEALYGFLFALAGESASLGIATSVAQRLCASAIGLAGGLFLLVPRERAAARMARAGARGAELHAG